MSGEISEGEWWISEESWENFQWESWTYVDNNKKLE